MQEVIPLTVIMPAFNEEDNLDATVKNLIGAFSKRNLDWQLILIDDGSTDRTKELAEKLAYGESRIKVIHNRRNMGIGYCFRQGIKNASKKIITWIPADGENDPNDLIKYLPLLEHVDIVIPFVLNVGIRSWGRRVLSTVYLWIINLSFGTIFNYTNGTVMYRRRIFDVIQPKANGLFFQTECLIAAVRSGFIFAEVPVILHQREKGQSKALTLKSFMSVVINYIRFFAEVHILRISGKVRRREEFR